jgi:hypothetical protein
MNTMSFKIRSLTAIIIFTLFFTSCIEINVDDSPKIKGDGPVVEEEIHVSRFNAVESSICGNIFFSQGNEYKCTIKAQGNIIEVIDFDVKNNRLEISSDAEIKTSNEISIFITSPEYTSLALTGSGDIIAQTAIYANNIQFRLTGAGNIKIDDFAAKQITTEITGTGSVKLSGKDIVDLHKITISGTGNIESIDLPVKEIRIFSSGVGNCNIHAIDILDVTISGVGNVFYKGSPSISSKISGVGSLTKMN